MFLNNKLKPVLLGSLAVVLVALVVFAFVGFNNSIALSNGHQFTVKFNTAISQEERTEYSSELKTILSDNQIKKYELLQIGSSHDAAIQVMFQSDQFSESKLEALQTSLQNAIEEQLNENEEFAHLEISELEAFGSSLTTKSAWLSVLGLAMLMVGVAIYVFIRYDGVTTIAVSAANLHNTIALLALITLFRIPVSQFVFVAIGMGIVLTTTLALIYFSNIRDSFLKNDLVKMTNQQMVEQSVKSSLNLYALLKVLAIVVGCALMGIGAAYAIEIGASLILVSMLAIFSNIAIAPSIWSLMFNRENDKRLQQRLLKKNAPTKEEDKAVV